MKVYNAKAHKWCCVLFILDNTIHTIQVDRYATWQLPFYESRIMQHLLVQMYYKAVSLATWSVLKGKATLTIEVLHI